MRRMRKNRTAAVESVQMLSFSGSAGNFVGSVGTIPSLMGEPKLFLLKKWEGGYRKNKFKKGRRRKEGGESP